MAKPCFTARQIGARVCEARKARGLTQITVAQHAGISKGFYCDVEHGAEISASRLLRIAHVLGVSVDHLLTGTSASASVAEERAEHAEADVARLTRQVDDLAQDRVTADADAAQLRAELATIDAVLARRPALDRPTRVENVQHAVATAGRMTDRVVTLERELAGVRANWQLDQRVLDQLKATAKLSVCISSDIPATRAAALAVLSSPPAPSGIAQERERVLALIDLHAAKYLNASDQLRFQEVIGWIKDDARKCQQPAPSGWQPIASAPKDRTSVLGYTPHAFLLFGDVFYNPDTEEWEREPGEHVRPTHWMELPEPPK